MSPDEPGEESSLLADARTLPLQPLLEHFQTYGFARLGPVLCADGAAALSARAEALMLGKREIPGLFFQHDSKTGRYSFDYAIFIGFGIAVLTLSGVATVLVRGWRSSGHA